MGPTWELLPRCGASLWLCQELCWGGTTLEMSAGALLWASSTQHSSAKWVQFTIVTAVLQANGSVHDDACFHVDRHLIVTVLGPQKRQRDVQESAGLAWAVDQGDLHTFRNFLFAVCSGSY